MSKPITRQEVAAKIDRGDVTIVEALPPMHYQDAHLPGALNLPHDRVDELPAAILPDKQAGIVVYCAAGSSTSTPPSRSASGSGQPGRGDRADGVGRHRRRPPPRAPALW